MLFTSYEFVLVFLPITLLTVLGVSSLGRCTAAKLVLFAASVVFYAWWNPRYVVLLLALIAFNYATGTWLIDSRREDRRRRKAILIVGILANIMVLAYFKYTNFLATQIGEAIGHPLHIAPILLPLGISFMVFQKIAFLVDAYGGDIKRLGLLDYAVFVSFFPQLISGPIVHHREVVSQLEQANALRYSVRLTPIAISFLVIGAFKKVVLADALSPHVGSLFEKASSGIDLGLFESWNGAISYTLQVYFDFSGYSDMAVGLALLFGIRLPINFNSPLKAIGPIDYWNRWHITLTRFLMAYIYNPLVARATRQWITRGRHIHNDAVMRLDAFVVLIAMPTGITMFIAGAWHGAGYQFVVFGLIHGGYLVANQAWRNLRRPTDDDAPASMWGIVFCRVAMFVGAVAAVPYFRADSVTSAFRFTRGMVGVMGTGELIGGLGSVLFIAVCILIVQLLPNTYELLREQLESETRELERHPGAIELRSQWSWPRISWRPTLFWALGIGLAGWYVLTSMAHTTEFLYFQF